MFTNMAASPLSTTMFTGTLSGSVVSVVVDPLDAEEPVKSVDKSPETRIGD